MELFFNRDAVVVTGYEFVSPNLKKGTYEFTAYCCNEVAEQVMLTLNQYIDGMINGGPDECMDAMGHITGGPLVVVFRSHGGVKLYVGGVHFPGEIILPIDRGPVTHYSYRIKRGPFKNIWSESERLAGSRMDAILNRFAHGRIINTMVCYDVGTGKVEDLTDGHGGIVTQGLPDHYERTGYPSGEDGVETVWAGAMTADESFMQKTFNMVRGPYFDSYGAHNILEFDDADRCELKFSKNMYLTIVSDDGTAKLMLFGEVKEGSLIIRAYYSIEKFSRDNFRTALHDMIGSHMGTRPIKDVWLDSTVSVPLVDGMEFNRHEHFTVYDVDIKELAVRKEDD